MTTNMTIDYSHIIGLSIGFKTMHAFKGIIFIQDNKYRLGPDVVYNKHKYWTRTMLGCLKSSCPTETHN